MSAVIQASGLGKAYRRTWALRDCTLAIPEGRVTGPRQRMRGSQPCPDARRAHTRR
jgi:hypothetical protein